MTTNNFCKKLKRTCSNLKNKCTSKLGLALGRFTNATKCKRALGSNANKKVSSFCKKRCGLCDSLGRWYGGYSGYGGYGGWYGRKKREAEAKPEGKKPEGKKSEADAWLYYNTYGVWPSWYSGYYGYGLGLWGRKKRDADAEPEEPLPSPKLL